MLPTSDVGEADVFLVVCAGEGGEDVDEGRKKEKKDR